jgi:hypothetical protein
MNKEVNLCQVVNGQRVYPRAIIWRAGTAIESGGVEVLARHDVSCERVLARTWRGSVIATFYWRDGAWSSVEFKTMAGLRTWCHIAMYIEPEIMS